MLVSEPVLILILYLVYELISGLWDSNDARNSPTCTSTLQTGEWITYTYSSLYTVCLSKQSRLVKGITERSIRSHSIARQCHDHISVNIIPNSVGISMWHLDLKTSPNFYIRVAPEVCYLHQSGPTIKIAHRRAKESKLHTSRALMLHFRRYSGKVAGLFPCSESELSDYFQMIQIQLPPWMRWHRSLLGLRTNRHSSSRLHVEYNCHQTLQGVNKSLVTAARLNLPF